MKLLLILFISSVLVLSIGCASQDASDVAELVKEVELLREEVHTLKCHYHQYGGMYSGQNETNQARVRDRGDIFGVGLCKQGNPYTR